MKHSQGKRKKERHETNHSCDHLGSIKHLLDLTSGLLHSGSQLSFEMLTHRLLAESNGNSTLYHIGMIDLCLHRQGYVFRLAYAPTTATIIQCISLYIGRNENNGSLLLRSASVQNMSADLLPKEVSLSTWPAQANTK